MAHGRAGVVGERTGENYCRFRVHYSAARRAVESQPPKLGLGRMLSALPSPLLRSQLASRSSPFCLFARAQQLHLHYYNIPRRARLAWIAYSRAQILVKMSETQTLSRIASTELDLGVGTSSGAGYKGLAGSRPLTIASLLEQPIVFVKQQQKSKGDEVPYKPINQRVSEAHGVSVQLELTLCCSVDCSFHFSTPRQRRRVRRLSPSSPHEWSRRQSRCTISSRSRITFLRHRSLGRLGQILPNRRRSREPRQHLLPQQRAAVLDPHPTTSALR